MLKRYCFEPLTAKPRVEPGSIDPFCGDPPPEADAEAVASQRSAAQRVTENCSWLIWGSGMAETGYATDMMTGRLVRFDDQGIVATIGHPVNRDGKRAPHVAARIAACVNACQGIESPVEVVALVRTLLADMASGNANVDDIRVTSLLDRMSREEKP